MVPACSSSAATRCSCGSMATGTRAVPARPRCGCARTLADVGRIDLPDAKVTLADGRRACTREASISSPWAPRTSSCCLPAPRGAVPSRWNTRPRPARSCVSPETAALLPTECLGDPKAPGVLLRHEPPGHDEKRPYIPRPKMAPEPLVRCLSPAIRAHVLAGGGTSEHRPVTIAFIRFEGTDALIEQHGAQAAADALHQLVSVVEAATEELDVAFLASDVDARRRQADPDRGRAEGHRRRRRTHASRVAQDRRKQVFAADPHRRPPRLGLRRRYRAAVPPHLHGHGRRGEPGRARDGQGRAGMDLRDGRRARPLQHAVRDDAARALRGEGQGGAGPGLGGRPRQGLANPAGDAATAAADRPQRRTRRDPQGVHERALGGGAADRSRRRLRDRQDPAARSAARRGSGIPEAPRHLRGLHRVDPVRRVARAAARDVRIRPRYARSGGPGTRSRRSGGQGARPRAVAAAARGGVRRRNGRPRPRSESWRKRTAARSCTRPSRGSSKPWCPTSCWSRSTTSTTWTRPRPNC